MPPIDYANFSIKNYLTTDQQNTYQTINKQLKGIVLELIGSEKLEDFKNAYLTFDILDLCTDEDLKHNVDNFLITFLSDFDDNKGTYLEKIIKICSEQCQKVFFECASTKKIQYYSINWTFDKSLAGPIDCHNSSFY